MLSSTHFVQIVVVSVFLLLCFIGSSSPCSVVNAICTERSFVELSYQWSGGLTEGIGTALPNGNGLFYVGEGGDVKFTFVRNISSCSQSQRGTVTTVVNSAALSGLGMTEQVSAMELAGTNLYILAAPYVFVIVNVTKTPIPEPLRLAGPFSTDLPSMLYHPNTVKTVASYLFVADRGAGCFHSITDTYANDGLAHYVSLGRNCGDAEEFSFSGVHSVFGTSSGVYIGVEQQLYFVSDSDPRPQLSADFMQVPQLAGLGVEAIFSSPASNAAFLITSESLTVVRRIFQYDLETKDLNLTPLNGTWARQLTFQSNGNVWVVSNSVRALTYGVAGKPIKVYHCGQGVSLMDDLFPPTAFCEETYPSTRPPTTSTPSLPSRERPDHDDDINISVVVTVVVGFVVASAIGCGIFFVLRRRRARKKKLARQNRRRHRARRAAVDDEEDSFSSFDDLGDVEMQRPPADGSPSSAGEDHSSGNRRSAGNRSEEPSPPGSKQQGSPNRSASKGTPTRAIRPSPHTSRPMASSKEEAPPQGEQRVSDMSIPSTGSNRWEGVSELSTPPTAAASPNDAVGKPSGKKAHAGSSPTSGKNVPEGEQRRFTQDVKAFRFPPEEEAGSPPSPLNSLVDAEAPEVVPPLADRSRENSGASSASIAPGTLLSEGSIPGGEDMYDEERTLIRRGEYSKLKLLGRGSYGIVYSCLLSNGRTIAMKEMTLNPGDFEIAAGDVEHEMDVIRQVQHKNIVQYISARAVTSTSTITLFMELVSGGSLTAMARSLDPPREIVVRRLIRQATEGLAFIHSKGIIHRDIKGDNMLLTTDGVVKLADFGTAKALAPGATRGAQTMIGTPYYMAPELLTEGDDGEVGYGMKADVWSLGVTVAEILNRGDPPWPTFTNPGQAFLYIASPGRLPEIPEGASELARDFILWCCRRDVKERPSCAQLLEHPWLCPPRISVSSVDPVPSGSFVSAVALSTGSSDEEEKSSEKGRNGTSHVGLAPVASLVEQPSGEPPLQQEETSSWIAQQPSQEASALFEERTDQTGARSNVSIQ